VSDLVGAGAVVASRGEGDVFAHAVPDGGAGRREPALALFAPSQAGRIAFTTARPLLTARECERVLAAVDAHVRDALGGKWSTVRRSSLPTTDVAVEDVARLVPWLRALLASRVFPLCAACFPALGDGSALDASRLRVHDAFVVKYDAALGSVALPEHSDTSALSLSLTLSADDAYGGGGLYLRALDRSREGGGGAAAGSGAGAGALTDEERGVVRAPRGCATVFAGPLRHGGAPIAAGVRVILVLFLYVEGFAYGALQRKEAEAAAERALEEGEGAGADAGAGGARAAASSPPGFVIYRETAALVEALESSA
jgi:hypothetical protein